MLRSLVVVAVRLNTRPEPRLEIYDLKTRRHMKLLPKCVTFKIKAHIKSFNVAFEGDHYLYDETALHWFNKNVGFGLYHNFFSLKTANNLCLLPCYNNII